ncbi:MAG: hypothetical protein CSA33_01795 [Desulfobulbus propionicus]|nr:MAG: hypothetical protein CSA33_01795 [Desulfobulbus propionicus]
MNDQAAFNKMTKARTSLVLKHPFFASLALHLNLREDITCRDAWTDGRVIGYNPHYINILSDAKLEGLTAHLVLHPAFGHHKRRGNRDVGTWNKACDYVVNAILADAGFTLPEGSLFKSEYEGKSAEDIYAHLTRGNSEEEPQETPAAEENADGATENEAEGAQGTEPETSLEKQGDDQGSSQGESSPAGAVRDDPHGGSEEAQSITETDWEEALVQAAHTARELGRLSLGLERLIQDTLAPRLCWQQLLARFIERSNRSDYTWVTPNRRYLHQDIYLPAMQNSTLSHMVVALDTSGSIQSAELDQFAAELNAITELHPTTMHLISCDMEIQEHRILQNSDLPMRIRPKGGGGTDYRPVFGLVEKEGLRPACLIYLTDLVCRGFPAQEPPYPVLWVQIGNEGTVPPFGEVIHLDRQ